MNSRLIGLAERRERLIAMAAIQRSELAVYAEPWKGVFSVADKGIETLRYLRRHPIWLVGAVGLFVALRPRRIFALIRWGWPAWKMVRKIRQRLYRVDAG